MKAIIVDVKENRAAVLSDDGSVYSIKSKDYFIGQHLEVKKRIFTRGIKIKNKHNEK